MCRDLRDYKDTNAGNGQMSFMPYGLILTKGKRLSIHLTGPDRIQTRC